MRKDSKQDKARQFMKGKPVVLKDDDSPAMRYWKARKKQMKARDKIDRFRMIKDSVEKP
jgi:hypothetical protein